MKTCNKCKKYLPLDNFYPVKKTGYYIHCKRCKKVENAEYKLENYEKIALTSHKYINTEKGYTKETIDSIFHRYKKKSSRKKWIPECTREQVYDELKLYIQEHGRICEYCKEPWTHERKMSTRGDGPKKCGPRIDTNFSIDRLDSTETYMVTDPALNQISNLVFCCIGCNNRKNQVTLSDIDNIKRVWGERHEVG